MEISSYLKGQIETRLKYDNPWWTSNSIPEDYAAMHNRPYIELFYPLVKDKSLHRSIVLMGPRRVGKTVMIFHTIERLISDGIDPKTIIYLSIDTPIYNGISLEEMFAFSREALGNSGEMTDYYVFFDEIQYLSGWEVHLKSLGDSYRNTKFVASGSAAAALKEKSNESGAGRFLDFMLPPLTFSEYIELKGLGPQIVKKSINWNGRNVETYDAFQIEILNQHFIDYINFGGYPEIVFSGKMQANPGQYIRHDIVDKVLLRDLPSLYGISDTRELNRLFIYIAYRSGQEFTYENLSTDSGIGKEVLKKYLQYLEAAFLIKVINKVDSNARHLQRITAFKIYLKNPSLRCALFSPIGPNDENIGSMVVPDVSKPIVPCNRTRHLNPVLCHQSLCNCLDGSKFPRPDIERMSVAGILQQPEDRSVGHVFDIDEIARLLPVLEEVYLIVVLDDGRENREDAGVWVRE